MQLELSSDIGERWMLYMRRGDFAAAWRLSDLVLRARGALRCDDLPRHLQWVWDGRSLEQKRVLVRCYHGLGDTVHFIRYAPLVKSVAAEVTVLAQSELLPLLSSVPGIDRLLPLKESVLRSFEGPRDRPPRQPLVRSLSRAQDERDIASDYDVDVEVMELPYVFRTTLETIPAHIPYLHASDGQVQSPPSGDSVSRPPMLRQAQHERITSSVDRKNLPLVLSPSKDVQVIAPQSCRRKERCGQNKLSVGIVWAAGTWDRRRSIPAALLAPLASVPGIELQIFQVGEALAEPREWAAVMPRWSDIVMEARLIRALDLMISVDSLPAHLAGALGVPVWTLLQKEADWRWMEARDDSPWYPTMRLFRQKRAGEWQPVIASVAAELAKLSAAHRATAVSRQRSAFSDHSGIRYLKADS